MGTPLIAAKVWNRRRAGKMAAQKQPQSIDISQLPLPQLNSLNQQLEQEIEFLGNSLSQLKTLQAKFNESQECVGKLSGQESGKQMLVPLTGSMYVQGEIAETDKVLIDVGTGYYMEKTCEGAKGYFQRKVDYLTKQMEKLQPVVQEKYKMKQAIMEMLQAKVQAQMQSQQQPGAVAAK